MSGVISGVGKGIIGMWDCNFLVTNPNYSLVIEKMLIFEILSFFDGIIVEDDWCQDKSSLNKVKGKGRCFCHEACST